MVSPEDISLLSCSIAFFIGLSSSVLEVESVLELESPPCAFSAVSSWLHSVEAVSVSPELRESDKDCSSEEIVSELVLDEDDEVVP